MLLPIFLGHVLLGVPLEGVGWRGFALPKLQTKYSALASSLIVGVLWGVWHIPLFLQKGYPTPISSFPVWFVLLLGNAIVYTCIYTSTRGSLLPLVLFHAAYNTAFPAEPSLLIFSSQYLKRFSDNFKHTRISLFILHRNAQCTLIKTFTHA